MSFEQDTSHDEKWIESTTVMNKILIVMVEDIVGVEDVVGVRH
jgi:hypothetical protein